MDGTDGYALVNGFRHHFREWGSDRPDLPVLLALHGYTSHCRSFDAIAPALATHFRVVAVDARGHGETEWAPDGDYTGPALVSDVVSLASALGIGRASVIGASMGGRTSYNLAARHPGLVDRLVVVDISPSLVAAGSERIRGGAQRNDRFATVEEAEEAQIVMLPLSPPSVVRHRVRHNLMRLEDGSFTWRYDPVLRTAEGLPRPDEDEQWALIERVTAPTLLVHGALSDLLSPALADRMQKTISGCRVVDVPGAGHSVVADQPALFLAAVLPFLVEA